MKCNFTTLRLGLIKQLVPILRNSLNLSDVSIRQSILNVIKDMSKSMLISTPSEVLKSFELVSTILKGLDDAIKPDLNLILAAFTEWRNKPINPSEDTSSDKLNSLPIERFNDDIWETYYGSAINAKIRAKQQANKIGVRSLLYNENGIILSTCDLNYSVQQQQELLLLKVILYLKSRVPLEERVGQPDIFERGRMYENGFYTGIVEKIQRLYDKFLNEKNFDVMTLNKLFNNNDYVRLDAYNSWIILNNFDTILQQTYGKALAINPDSPKYTADVNKYMMGGGSNVFNTWRTTDEIDLSKEINNVTQSIVTSLPLIYAGSTTPTELNIKFNEFVYIISKIKDLPFKKGSNDYVFDRSTPGMETLSETTLSYIDGKSFFYIINDIRTNPQKILPIIFEILNNNNIRNILKGKKVFDENAFLSIDLDLINSIDIGLFNGTNSLFNIQSKSGFKGVNYYAYISQTVDSIYKAGFLQYFRDLDGKVYIRNMFDQSINNIQYGILTTINSINSQMLILNYDESTYNVQEEKRILNDGTYNIEYNNEKYTFTIGNGRITARNISSIYQPLVLDVDLIYRLAEKYTREFGLPKTVSYEVKNFRGNSPLKVTVDITTGDISYSVDGKPLYGFNDGDYEPLAEIIQNVLKLNFNIDEKYFLAFHRGHIGKYTNDLMLLVSRVITNLFISNHYLKGLTPKQVRKKVEEIYISPETRPVFNRKLNEINLLTEKESGILALLALAKALVTGRLTSSLILDAEGNSLSASTLSRGLSTMPYQILQQVKQPDSAAKDFTLWQQGVYLGIQQLKEFNDKEGDQSKSLTAFSAKEMEESAIVIDFIQSLLPEKSRTSAVNDGIAAFLPSENADKTYIGRLLVNLKKIKVNGLSLFDLLRTGKSIKKEFIPVIIKELGDFYQKAQDNINSDWKTFNDTLNEEVSDYNRKIILEQLSSGILDTSKLIPTFGNSSISYGHWEYIDIVSEKLGVTPLELVNEITTKYNNKNPQKPLVLIDLVHYVADKNGNLGTNKSFLANVNRFGINSFTKFILNQEIDLLKTLLNDKVSIDANEDIKYLLKDDAKSWVDPDTGKLILAKEWNYDPTIDHWVATPIRRNLDVGNFNVNAVHGIELNPLISNYNLLNFFFTLEYMNSTVGAYYAHPSKDKSGTVEGDEKSRKLAQDKRNVSFTAAMHAFQKNLLQGIPDEINMAVMPDVIDVFETISGDIFDDTKPFDGATFGNPFYTILENNSLGGAKVGVNKKTFTHFYDPRTGTGGIVKTAEFPLTNNLIRNSKFYQVMMLNMTDREWYNLDGSPAVVDITKDYQNNPIIFSNPNSQNSGQLYFKKDGKYYAILAIRSEGNNQYYRILQEVDSSGNATGEQVIEANNGKLYRQGRDGEGNSLFLNISNENEIITKDELIPTTVNTNYKLWKLFGGEWAMELKVGDSQLTPTEHSINVVVDIMNNTGTIKEGVTEVRYQSDIWLPLKHADIHLMPTVGALKLGAGNINSLEAYTRADSSKINFMRIKLNLSGVLLDKEHHANGDELSIMTLVLSACAARGFTLEKCLEMYNALAALAKNGIKENLEAFDEFFKNPNGAAKDKYLETILNILINAFAHNKNTPQMLLMVTLELLNKAKEGKDIAFQELNTIPYSDPSVFRRLHSTISVALTRAAIKIKVDGILSVLQPSYNAIKLYDDKLLGSFENEAEIIALLKARDKDPLYELRNNISKIRIGRTYKMTHPDGSIKLATIKTHNEYYKLKKQLRLYPNSIVSIREQFAPMEGFEGGRELAAYNATFLSESGKFYNFYDLSSVLLLSRLKAVKASDKVIKLALLAVLEDLMKLSKKEGTLYMEDASPLIITKDRNITKLIAKEIGGIDVLRHPDANGMHFGNPFTHTASIKGAINVGSVKNATEAFDAWLRGDAEYKGINLLLVEPERRAWILEQINSGRLKGKPIIYYTDRVPDKSYGVPYYNAVTAPNHAHILLKYINGNDQITINPKSVLIEPYEIVMPKVFKDIFGLDTYDDLNRIKEDKEFFTKRLFERTKVLVPNSRYSLALLRISGRHTYLLESSRAVLVPGEFYKKPISLARDEKKLWRVDRNGKKLYLMNEGDEVWVQIVNGKEVEVIVTDNFSSYIKNLKFNTLNISPESNSENIVLILRKSKKRGVKNFLRILDNEYNLSGRMSYATAIHNLNFLDLEDSPLKNYFRLLGAEIHTSFLKSLEVVAARIPALSMQSFMPMKVVAFDAPDINTAYVNTAHFLFLGSDLDIDAVSLAAYAFDHSGKYLLHSPFANIESLELLEASENLPFPTGETLEVGGEQVLDYSEYISTDSNRDFSKPFIMFNKSIYVNDSTPEALEKLGKLIRICNRLGYVPDTPNSNPSWKSVIKYITSQINLHNDYINDESVDDFSKNFIVNSMYEIGIDPANLIESQLAMDTITKPLKEVANSTMKAQKDTSLGNPGSFATNIHGITQNMAGKLGVGICAVGLKSYFAATARYNEVLANGTPEEVMRLKSDVEIAQRHFRTLSNIYTTNVVNLAILGEIYFLLDQGTDQALILSALLSLATDNAKELALDKLNASNFLGMYIYGITIGMDFQTLAGIISSDTGIVLNELMSSNIISNEKGLSMLNIYDYLELGPQLKTDKPLSDLGGINIRHLEQEKLCNLAHYNKWNLLQKLLYLERFRVSGDIAFNKLLEKAEEYVQQVDTILNEELYLTSSDGSRVYMPKGKIYGELKKLNEGGEELRTLGLLLHINQGLEHLLLKSINYIETFTSVVSARKYSNYRLMLREYKLKYRLYRLDLKEYEKQLKEDPKNAPEKAPEAPERPSYPSEKWKFDFHSFVFDDSYRNAWIDIYEGYVNKTRFMKEPSYRNEILKVVGLSGKLNVDSSNEEALNDLYLTAISNLRPSKVFYNVLDIVQVPHYMSYLVCADMLHQNMMKTSAKYRALYTLGRLAISIIGAYLLDDRENILKRVEQFTDRFIRDRFLVLLGYKIKIPAGLKYFKLVGDKIVVTEARNSETFIELGTRAGNASFKAFMETKVIPDLLEGRVGKNRKDLSIMDNAFIKSLAPVLYLNNPEYTTTVNMCPNINMSPRSDAERALFEQIKYDFNLLRMTNVQYLAGTIKGPNGENIPVKYDLIELFWLYNLIAFNGRVGENTLTTLFTDLFDYTPIKKYRRYITDFDNNHDISETTNVNNIIRESAPKANLWTTNLNYFHYEDIDSGLPAFWGKGERINYDSLPPDIHISQIRGYEPNILSYVTDLDLKNYVVNTNDQDITLESDSLSVPLKNGMAEVSIAYGGINQIWYYKYDKNGNPDLKTKKLIKIPEELKSYFKYLPTKILISAGNISLLYDIDYISSRIDNLINCY